MNLNLLVRGQSNAILAIESNGWAGSGALVQEVQRLLGFDGQTDTVSLVYERYDASQATAFGGTALIGDWLEPVNGDWRQGWTNGLEQALLTTLGGLPAGQKDDPTATLWFHSEYDSANRSLTADEWVSAVRHDADQVRAVLGQGAGSTPYLFVSAMPYWGSDEGHNAIRQGMERLAAEDGFNAAIAARTLDTDVDNDDTDGNQATRDYGGPHMDPEDGMQTLLRSARAIAESLSDYAKPGSPVALAGGAFADAGPQVIRAELAGGNQLRLDVAHDGAAGFAGLDGDAAGGVGWSVRGAGGVVEGSRVEVVDADTLLVTFDGEVPADGLLHYGWGYGRLAGGDGSGRGHAIYDDQGLPVWVQASGLKLGTSVAPLEGAAPAPTPAPTPDPTPTPTPTPEPTPTPTPTRTPGGRDLTGTAGNDILAGRATDDRLDGGAGDDRLLGRAGNDLLRGGEGRDRLFGGAGEDWLDGGAGHDRLRGGAGSDDLKGLAGDDVLRGGRDHDGLTGGAGADIFAFARGDGPDWVVDFTPGEDRLRLEGIAEADIAQRTEPRWAYQGLVLDLGQGDELYLQGLTRPLTSADIVFG